MGNILLLLGAAALLFYQRGKDFLTRYKIKFVDALFNKSKTADSFYTKIHFTIRADVDNTSDFAGAMQDVKLAVSFKNKLLGTVEKKEPTAIAANGKTRIEIPVAVPTSKLFDNVTTIINAITKGQALVFNIKGDLTFGIGKISINEDYKVQL